MSMLALRSITRSRPKLQLARLGRIRIRHLASASDIYPSIPLKCGLEIHAQLRTKTKLFSDAPTSFNAKPNSKVSFFDAALPGTQPILNKTALLLALRAATALDCTVSERCSFDRKHYFYGDQPAGYQITQYYHPIAKHGKLGLYIRDGVKTEGDVRILQVQIEQDTGKTIYGDQLTTDTLVQADAGTAALVDLNRTNSPLIEIVTGPDITDPVSAGAFVRKLQALLRHLNVCTGDLETGAMRVDVNVSVGPNGQRCEVKNLSSVHAVISAIKAEYKRQCELVANGGKIERETLGWDGKSTFPLRSKSKSFDYRFMPDPELPKVVLASDTPTRVKESLPRPFPDDVLKMLLSSPYSLYLKDARTIQSHDGLLEFYKNVFDIVSASPDGKPKTVGNWIVNDFVGYLSAANTTLDFLRNKSDLSSSRFADFVLAVNRKQLTTPSAKLLLQHLVANPQDWAMSIPELIKTFDLGVSTSNTTTTTWAQIQGEHGNSLLLSLCERAIQENPDHVAKYKSGKVNVINYLMGKVLRECQGKLIPDQVRDKLKELMTMK